MYSNSCVATRNALDGKIKILKERNKAEYNLFMIQQQ